MSGLAEALAAQARDSEIIVGSLKQIEGQAVALDAESVADRSDVGEDVKR